jgi:hypothetical protein
LVFDFTKLGGEQSLEDDEIEFHRIGIDRIRSLLEALPSKCDDDTKPSLEPKEPDSSSSVRLDAVGRLKTAVAEPDSAVFLPASRTRSTSWHLLKSSTDDLDDLPPAKSDPDIPPAGPAPLDATVRPESSSASRSDQPQVVKGDEMSSQPLLVREAASPLEIPAASSLPAAQSYDAIVGVAGESPQFGILGRFHGRTIALDLNQTHTISLFGVQGGGKSYTLGSIIEMACLPLPGINHLPRPTLQQIGRFRRSAQVYRKPGPRGGSGRNRAGDAAQGDQRLGRQPRPAFGSRRPDRTVNADRPASVQFSRVVEAHSEGQCCIGVPVGGAVDAATPIAVSSPSALVRYRVRR